MQGGKVELKGEGGQSAFVALHRCIGVWVKSLKVEVLDLAINPQPYFGCVIRSKENTCMNMRKVVSQRPLSWSLCSHNIAHYRFSECRLQPFVTVSPQPGKLPGGNEAAWTSHAMPTWSSTQR